MLYEVITQGGSGMMLERVTAGHRPLPHQVFGTIARVELPHPLPSGGSIDVELAWKWTLPDYGYGRMGRDGSLYEVAQWYPRAAVYSYNFV